MKSPLKQQSVLRQIHSATQLLTLFDLMPDISFFMKDRHGKFVSLNRRGCEYCGVKSEREAFGKTDRDFFPAARAAEYMADDQSVMKTGKPILNRIEPAPEMAGSPHLVVTNKIPLYDQSGNVIGLAGFSRRVEQVRCAPAAMNRLAKSVDCLHSQFREPMNSEDLAKQAGLSVSQFERIFRKAFGTSPRQYLLRLRIEHSCRLLMETDQSLSAIAQDCGFYDHPHFTRAFTTMMGLGPTNYRKSYRQ